MVVLARQASIPDAALVLVIAELADLPGPLGADVGRGAVGVVRRAPLRGHGRGARVPRAHRGPRRAAHPRQVPASRSRSPPSRPSLIAEIARMVRERSFGVSAARSHGRRRARHQRHADGGQRDGVEGIGGMGLWGPAVFTIPLLAAWYSYEHLALIRRTYDQTIRALGAAPELGGMVRDGHAERVAEVAVAMGGTLGFSRSRARAARDGRAAAPPRPGVPRRTRRRPPARARLDRAGRRHDPARAPSSSRLPATSSPPSGCRIGERVVRARR